MSIGSPDGLTTLLGHLDRGDAAACAAQLLATTPAERRRWAPEVRRVFEAVREGTWETEGSSSRWRAHGTDAQRDASSIALLGTATRAELTSLRVASIPSPAQWESVLTFVRALQPPWLAEWATLLCELSPRGWPLARRLIREGLSDKPSTASYTLAMTSHGFGGRHQDGPRDVLQADPALLDDEVWRLFEHEGSGELSLAAHDKYTHDERSWSQALLTLMAEGRLSRARLLDASLAALERDFAQFRAGWFSRFHASLEPTTAERAARVGVYLRLLGSNIAPTVSFALDQLEPLVAAGAVPAEDLLARAPPALRAKAKGTVRRALALLSAVAGRGPERARVAPVAALALAHEAPEVQAAALKLIEALGTPEDTELRARVTSYAELVAPSMRAAVAAWLTGAGETTAASAPSASSPRSTTRAAQASGEAPSAAAGAEHAPPATTTKTVHSSIAEARRLTSIDGAEQLLDRLAFLLENPGETDTLELALDATSRVAASPPERARAAPLVKRARTLASRTHLERPVVFEVARVALAWTTRERVERTPSAYRSALDFFHGRHDALVERLLRGEARPLLSAPTHPAGFIDPHVWVARLRTAHTDDPWDVVLSLLRLSPDGRAPALAAARTLPGELGALARHALGAPDEPIGTTTALWLAAARARAPHEDDDAVERTHPRQGRGGGQAGRLTPEVASSQHTYRDRDGVERTIRHHWIEIERAPALPSTVEPLHLSVLLHACHRAQYWSGGMFSGDEPTLRWAATLWPAWREPFFAEAVEALSRNLDGSEARWHDRAYLEPLVDPSTPMTPLARLTLAVALAAKQPDQHGLAVDALVLSIHDHRLPAALFGETMATLTSSGVVLAARWAKTLAEVARVSPSHAAWVVQVLIHALRGPAAHAPKDLSKLLELLHELSLETGATLTDPDARAYLGALETGGKTAKLVKALLART
jgi:hypothetical protein